MISDDAVVTVSVPVPGAEAVTVTVQVPPATSVHESEFGPGSVTVWIEPLPA